MVRTIIKIDGMMCGMCEAHINDVIRKMIPDVQKLKSSHSKGESSFVSENAPDEDKIRAAIDATGYKVVSINSEPYTKKFLGLF
ncbi:MAG: cation transporter [Lachnospiraceae bacterium]|nr:cation transporter [Lachnospiraceae bacterium]